jgi:16S rRNA (guanine527-N7)-methyltransferase
LTKNEIWLRTIVQKNNLAITDIELEKLAQYCMLLGQWNKSINLISRRDEENIWQNHILISLVFLLKIEFPRGANVLDLGTGGGLPGIPLSIMRRDLNFVLLDSIRKKMGAVQDMVNVLDLPNITVVCNRAEELGRVNKYRNIFDAVIARGVASLDDLVEWATPLLKHGDASRKFDLPVRERVVLTHPALITMKGGETSAEYERAKKRFPSIRIHSVDMTFKGSEDLQNSERKIILVENN